MIILLFPLLLIFHSIIKLTSRHNTHPSIHFSFISCTFNFNHRPFISLVSHHHFVDYRTKLDCLSFIYFFYSSLCHRTSLKAPLSTLHYYHRPPPPSTCVICYAGGGLSFYKQVIKNYNKTEKRYAAQKLQNKCVYNVHK